MGKFKDGVNIAGTRVFNTAATPFRMWGAVGNAVGNVLRQWQSSAKNTAEVGKQTIDALVDNFLNFSKVEGKRYQRLTKWTINLASAVTRRPAMIAGAGILSALNQWMRKPFTKLAPGKLFKDIGNAFRIFSKKKGFDFQTYDTHETKGDTWINQIKEKRIWFFGKWWSSEKKEAKAEKPVEKAKEADVPSPQKPQQQTNVVPMPAVAPKADKKPETKTDSKTDTPTETEKWATSKTEEKAKSIGDVKNKRKAEASAKDQAEKEAKRRKNLSKEDKADHKKNFEQLLENNMTEDGVLARAKKHKKGNTIEEVMSTLDKENITFATFIEDEILAKKTAA